jgi:hypothetical protein
MGGVCDTHGKQEMCIQGFGWETEGKGQLEDVGVDGRIIFK